MDDQDRLSQLPSHIIDLILSFMTTKTAIKKTSTLSKQWRYAWTTCSKLFFDQQEFILNHSEQPQEATSVFIKFVDRVLELRPQSNIRTFKVYWFYDVDGSKMGAWLNYAKQHNVQKLDLYVLVKDIIVFSCNFFHCQNLKKLRFLAPTRLEKRTISKFSYLKLPDSINLENLRYLDLRYVSCSPESFQRLLSACPLLEELLITTASDNFEICVPNVRNLHLICVNASVQILAPKLESLLGVLLNEIPEISTGSLPFIKEAEVWYYVNQEGKEGNGNKLINFLKKLCNARLLKLMGAVIKTLPMHDLSKQTFPLFHNLKILWVEASLNSCNISVIIMLLQKSPSLEELVLHNIKRPSPQLNTEGSRKDRIAGQDVCRFTNLKNIEIHGFLGTNDEFELVMCLLEKGDLLETMNINCHKSLSIEARHTITDKLLAISRSSVDVELLVQG